MSAPSRLRPALLLAVLASAALSPLTVGAQELRLTAENRLSLILTVYNQNLGLVSETRRVELPAGETVLALEEIGRAHVCTPVPNAHLVCHLLLEKKKGEHIMIHLFYMNIDIT